MADNFVFIDGPVAGRKKALLLAGHDFFLLPSRYEPCGLTDIEALYNGGQPIAPRLGGLVKAKNTIKYRIKDANDQAAELGGAIDKALVLFEDKHDLFLRRQEAASLEDFSVEKHVNQVVQNLRVEVYHRMQEVCARLVNAGYIPATTAQILLQKNVLDRVRGDRRYLARSLQRIHPSRRSVLSNWLIQQ